MRATAREAAKLSMASYSLPAKMKLPHCHRLQRINPRLIYIRDPLYRVHRQFRSGWDLVDRRFMTLCGNGGGGGRGGGGLLKLQHQQVQLQGQTTQYITSSVASKTQSGRSRHWDARTHSAESFARELEAGSTVPCATIATAPSHRRRKLTMAEMVAEQQQIVRAEAEAEAEAEATKAVDGKDLMEPTAAATGLGSRALIRKQQQQQTHKPHKAHKTHPVIRSVVEIFTDPVTNYVIITIGQQTTAVEESSLHNDFLLDKADFSDLTAVRVAGWC